MVDPNVPIELRFYRCVTLGGVLGGGGYVHMVENEIVRVLVSTGREYAAAVADGWLYVYRMLTPEHGWCHRDHVRSVLMPVAENRPYMNPPQWHLTCAQTGQYFMVQLVLPRGRTWLDYHWGETLSFNRTPPQSRPHVTLAGRSNRWNSGLVELFIRKVIAAYSFVTHGQTLAIEMEQHNDEIWYRTTIPVVVAPMGIAIRGFSGEDRGRRAAFFSSNSELIRQIRNVLFILGLAYGAQGDLVDVRVTLPPAKLIALGDLHIMCDRNQPPPPPGPPPEVFVGISFDA